MDMMFEEDTFYCKLSTSARLNDSHKKLSIYLFLDASHVESLEVCDNEADVILPSVTSCFVERAFCASPGEIVGLRFVLKRHAPLLAPDSILQKKPSSYDKIKALLQIGQSGSFRVYVPSSAISMKHLSALCHALATRDLKYAPEGIVKSLYPRDTNKLITRLDDISSLYPQGLPPYDFSTVVGTRDDESTGQSDFDPASGSRASRKRRISSLASRQTPAKRQLFTEKAAPNPWEPAIAAQGTQIAALCAQISILREEVQQLRHANVADARPTPIPYCVSPSRASTVVNTNEEFVMIVRDNVINQQEQRAWLGTDFDYNDEQIGLPHPCTPPPWSPTEVNTPTEVSTPTKAIAATRGHSSVDTDTPTNANVSFQAQTSSTHCPSSPHIRPTFLARGTKIERENALKAQHVREMLEALPNELVLEILSGSRVQDLLAIQQGPAQAKIPSSSDQFAVTKVKQTVTGHMDTDKYTDEFFNQKVKQAFKSLVHQRLDRLVHDQLPLAAELFFRSAVEDLRDQFYEDCKMNEASLSETVDEGCTTLHVETEKCTTEIHDLIQDRLDELEHQSNKFKISTGEQLACLGYWSNQFAESNGNQKHATKITERCMSV
ncbi:hypothetical protein D6C78_09473 [Aureobasidium pullulans]|uniref:Uncharacterized protein n=2 Tax=Aureobasidium TaxID=5579 RepID=A0A4T0BHA6_AURPU|nr:hypothetical protein E4T50_16155 [Aureobasidium sp. EXF-12298]KAI4750611.1 hypothetical protein E4T51_16085 [Aureobasidium sp. EXF-12344]KAI4768106.1 hypothetical protein E4T52_16791 [Aureobasidium sp. EXF-3400]TIA30622.1 hypothetical protein D6C78_09473 [Aureobasidium pullulans]